MAHHGKHSTDWDPPQEEQEHGGVDYVPEATVEATDDATNGAVPDADLSSDDSN